MSSQWIPEGLGYSSVMGVDPAVEWALGEWLGSILVVAGVVLILIVR